MTVIENIQRQRSISAGQTAPYASAESFGAGYADSLNRIGNSLLEKQKQRDELADLEAEAETKRALSDSRIELMKRQQELQLNHTGDAKGFADRFNNEARKFLEAGRSSLSNAKSAYMFNDAIDGMLTSFYADNLDFENRELRSQTIARTNMSIDNEVETVRRGGDVMLVGSVTGNVAPDFNVVTTFMRAVRVQGVAVGSRVEFENMNKAIARHALHPVVDRVFDGINSFKEALAHLAEGRHFGKIAIMLP